MTAIDRSLKIVVVGEPFVGKTSLIYAYTQQKFIDEYEPTVFQNYAASVTVNRRLFNLNLFDTNGQTQEKLTKLRIISYQKTDVVILCFSFADPPSLDSCKRRWIPEIRKHAKNAHILLVGLKEDLATSAAPEQLVDRKCAEKVAEETGCIKFLGCSALTLRGLKRVFDEALFLAATGQSLESKPQTISWDICCSLF